MNKRAVNYHTRDLAQYPFFNYGSAAKRRQSHAPGHGNSVSYKGVNLDCLTGDDYVKHQS